MARTMWFRNIIGLGDSLIVGIPAEIVARWQLKVGEKMVWRLDGTTVTVIPLKVAIGTIRGEETKEAARRQGEVRGDAWPAVWGKNRKEKRK